MPSSKHELRDNGALRIGSLCSGYGGLDLGLMAVVGGSVAWHVEYDKHPSAVLDARFPGVPNYGDLTTTDWTQVEPVDWLTAGYPCQPFSHAGKRKGSADERHLWPFVADAIGVLRPRRVLLENVAGHVSLGLDAVLWDLAALGYDATWGVVRAADAGAPHNRARIFIVATDTTGSAGSVGHRDDVRARRGADGRGTDARRGAAADASGERHGSGQDGRSVGRVDGEDARSPRQWERSRAVTGDRSATAPTDAGSGPFAGATAARVGLSVAAERGAESAADADEQGRQGAEPAGRFDVSPRSITADSAGARRSGTEDAGAGSSDAAPGVRRAEPERDGSPRVEWGVYESAIRRWERVLGRPAPRPTEPGRTGERLNPRFVEWMQGLAGGWVTDILGRNPALKALGNGVVPQQAALALRLLLSRVEQVAA